MYGVDCTSAIRHVQQNKYTTEHQRYFNEMSVLYPTEMAKEGVGDESEARFISKLRRFCGIH
jgi:hypothetical protein